MNLDDWDAPYTSPLRGCLMIIGWAAATLAALVALAVARGLLSQLFS